MNEKQKEFLKKWREENEMKFKLDGDWGDATCVHSHSIEDIYLSLKNLE